MSVPREQQRTLLLRVARQALGERGFEADFPAAVLAELRGLTSPAGPYGAEMRDLRQLPWCSIDNDDSRDLDQLTVAEGLTVGGTRVLVAVADVSAAVTPGSALDRHAAINTTSIYTPPQNFPMLPDRLSTDLTSLVRAEDRLAVVVEMVVDDGGASGVSSVYPAMVRNQAKLAYPSVGAWLEGEGEMPAAVGAVPGLADNLRLQDRVAQRLKARRHERGALELETVEVRTQFDGGAVSGQTAEKRNRAKELIEDFMIAANGAITRFLEERRFPVLRRVVRSPERWQRIVEIALAHGEELPLAPDAKALNDFLLKRRAADPLRFADLSLIGHQAARSGGVRGQLSRSGDHWTFRPGGERVHSFDRSQSPLPGSRHPAAAQGGAGRTRSALRPRSTHRDRGPLYPKGGRRPEGRAVDAQGSGGVPAPRSHRPGIRRPRHRRITQGNVGARLRPARRGPP